jgi:hypothetical protein
VQDPRPTHDAQTPAVQTQRRTERQAEARDEKNRSSGAPVPLDDRDLDRVGGGFKAPNTTW